MTATLDDVLAVLVRLEARTQKVSYSAAEAAAIVGLSESTIRTMVKTGQLTSVPHLGKRVLISHAELVRRFGHVDSDPTPPHGTERPWGPDHPDYDEMGQ